MDVSSLMTRLPHTMQVNQSIQHAADLMAKHAIGAVVIYDGSRLAGIVTDRDITVRGTAKGTPPDSAVSNIMTGAPVTIPPTASADSALRLMVDHAIGRLCVVEAESVVGIITFGDLHPLIRMLADGLARTAPVGTRATLS